MCGIAGIYNLKSKVESQKSKVVIKKMTNTLVHRGPDDEGYFVDDKIALGHRRLSIIDLSKAGHQPMIAGDLVIVFNGEIYNYLEIREVLTKKGYKFQSQTDTEVILAAYKEWGVKCQEKFNGMWAFVIYDRQRDILFASRDRFGVKPFYYYVDKDIFVFGSEIKAILSHPAVKTGLNDPAIRDYLVHGLIDHNEETLFKNIFELRGGHYLMADSQKRKADSARLPARQGKRIAIKRYWELPKETMKLSSKEYAQKFQELFLDAVKLRLRSDVPIGSCLSGGLDSSAIVCQVNELLKEKGKIAQVGDLQKTFSACYDPRYFGDIDEKKYMQAVISQTKAKPSYTYPSPKGLAREIEAVITHHDLPVLTSSVYAQWCVFRLAKEKGVKVMLDGQGSDEILAGYLTFFPVYFKALQYERKYWLLVKESFNFFRLHFHQIFSKPIARIFPLIGSLLRGNKLTLKEIYLGAYTDQTVFNQKWLKTAKLPRTKKIRSIQDLTQTLLTDKGLPALLRYEDRNSMAFSIESRTPFLDYRLVQFIFNLPDKEKIRQGQTKWILRQALKDMIPAKILHRHDKIGFDTPEEYWLKTKLAPLLVKTFSSKKFATRPYFNAEKVQAAFDRYIKGDPINFQLFWRIFNLEKWLEIFFPLK